MTVGANRCPACLDPSAGLSHTCEGSGTFRAAEAHASGEVDAIEEAWPIYTCDVRLRVRALDEDLARHRLTDLVRDLLADDQVLDVVISVKPEQAAAA